MSRGSISTSAVAVSEGQSTPDSTPDPSITSTTTTITSTTTITPDSTPDRIADLEHRISYLSDLLAESENTVERFTVQERVLKEEIRRLDRVEGVQDTNLVYVKNVLFKFFESGDKSVRREGKI